MSGDKDEDDKITVLYPDREEGESEAEGRSESDPEPEESDEPVDGDVSEPSTPEDESDDAGESAGEEDNVVRLDFQDKSDDESAPADLRDADPLEELPTDESVDAERAKFEVFRRMIDEGMVMVTLDTRVEGVDVPPKFQGLPELRLNFSHMFHIDDFDYDADGVRASLSFDGSRYFCQVPWDAVFMLYSHESGDVVVFEPSESPDAPEAESPDAPEDDE